jgi:hypothetical protein
MTAIALVFCLIVALNYRHHRVPGWVVACAMALVLASLAF